MKKAIRICMTFIMVFILLLSLCSCKYLDEIKSSRAYLSTETGNIEYNGSTYKLLSQSGDFEFLNNDYKSVCVADKEVPLLLGDTFGSYYSLMNGDNIITNDIYSYCKEAEYDYYEALISEPILSNYGILLDEYDEIKHEYKKRFWVFSGEYASAVEHAITSADWKKAESMYETGFSEIEIYRSDKEGLIGKNTDIRILAEISPVEEESKYYLYAYNTGDVVIAQVTDALDKSVLSKIYNEYTKPFYYGYE